VVAVVVVVVIWRGVVWCGVVMVVVVVVAWREVVVVCCMVWCGAV
jgi:hypothetical protein